MLLRLLEDNVAVDKIVFFDGGWEFPQMYQHIDQLEKYIGREITRLKPEPSFEYYMFDKVITTGKNAGKNGYGWPGLFNRWCTGVKQQTINKFIKTTANGEEINQFIGIAADEKHRAKNKKYPLIEYGMTERDCIKFCKNRGFHWYGLYTIFNRVSCYLCPLQGISELRKLYIHFPELWKDMLEKDARTRNNYTCRDKLPELDRRFRYEIEQQQKLF